MRNFLKIATVALLGFLSSVAQAQQGGQLQSGQVFGNATASAGQATGVLLGAILDRSYCSTQGDIMYRGASLWTCLAPSTSGLPLVTGGAAANPSFATLANAALATVGAATLKGNPSASAGATVTDFTIQGLTARGTPDATNDKIPLYDNAAGTIKYVTPNQIASAGVSGVSSINSNTGAFTSSKGITNVVNDLQTTFTQAGSNTIAADMVTKIKQYGPTPQDYGASGSDQNTTGTISSSSSSLSLTAAKDFANNQGIRINHAGASNGVNAVTSATATPVGTTGATTYTYQISSFGGSGSYGSAITAFTTTTGNATLNTSHYNQLNWTAPAGGTTPAGYAIYGRIGGALTLIALVPYGTNFYNDFGSTLQWGTAPDWLPTTPPGSAAASWLLTTVSSGGGTTTLTLGASATTSASSQGVYHDDTTTLGYWLTYCTANQVGCFLPNGTYNFTSAIVATGGNATPGVSWAIVGQSNSSSVLQYRGATVVIDLITIGTGAAGYNLVLKDFTIDSTTQLGSTSDQKTTGYALRLVSQSFWLVDGVNFGRTIIGGNHSNLFHAFYSDTANYVTFRNSFMIAQNACFVARTTIGVYMDNINQAECLGIGSWFGGGNGGIYLGYGSIYGASTCIQVNTALSGTVNYQFFHSINWICDTSGVHYPSITGIGVLLDDNLSFGNTHTYIMQGWSSAAAKDANFWINNWKNGQVIFSGAVMQASTGGADGLRISDSSTIVQIDGATNISNNSGYGVNAQVSTNNVYSDALVYSNSSGQYNANSHVEGTGNPGFRKHANGYIDIWGTSTGGAGSDVAVSFPLTCPNALLSLQGNVVGSGASGSQSVTVAFTSQSTSGFTGQVRLVAAGSVGYTASNYMWRALCN